jgi:hypothetical protein
MCIFRHVRGISIAHKLVIGTWDLDIDVEEITTDNLL